MCDNIEINIKEIKDINDEKGTDIVIDAVEYAKLKPYLDDDDSFFDQNNMHYIWKPVYEELGTTRTTRYEASEYWSKTPEGIVRKSLKFARTM